MNTVSRLAIAGMGGFLVASFASQGSAQDAVRDAAIHKCILEAQTRHPDISNPSNQRNRTDAYRACMAAAGLAP